MGCEPERLHLLPLEEGCRGRHGEAAIVTPRLRDHVCCWYLVNLNFHLCSFYGTHHALWCIRLTLRHYVALVATLNNIKFINMRVRAKLGVSISFEICSPALINCITDWIQGLPGSKVLDFGLQLRDAASTSS